MKNQRPVISRRNVRSRTSRFVASKRPYSYVCRPKIFVSSAPFTDSVSCSCAFMSPSRSCVRSSNRRWMFPTMRVGMTKSGSAASEKTVRRQSRNAISTIVVATIIRFENTVVKLLVTASWMPPTSLLSRERISPLRVEVKNRNDIFCRCEYRRLRMSYITPCPTRLLRYD